MATLTFTYIGYAHRLDMRDGRSAMRGGQIELTREEAERLTKQGHRFRVHVTADQQELIQLSAPDAPPVEPNAPLDVPPAGPPSQAPNEPPADEPTRGRKRGVS